MQQAPEQSSLDIYMQQISDIPLLTVQDEIDLAARIAKGDTEAREIMITSNLRLVVKIAQEYSNLGLSVLDLINEGNMGLMKAVERFDPSKGGKLSTYASWWIKQAIKRALANQSKTIRLPVHMVDRVTLIRRTAAKLSESLGREPTNEEIAETLNLPATRVSHLRNVSTKPASLDSPINEEDGSTLGEVVPDEKSVDPYESLKSKSLIGDVNLVLSMLEPREADIIRLRFGLDGRDPLTLEQVGEQIGITRALSGNFRIRLLGICVRKWQSMKNNARLKKSNRKK